MAEIDKSLPNVKQTINVPSPEEVQVEIQEEQQEQDRINLMRETDPEAYQEYLAEQEDLLGESA